MADYVVVDKEQLEADLTTVSDSIRGLLETEEKLEFPQGMKEAIESYSLDEPLTTQDALIEQIKTALQGKASGGEDYFKYIWTLAGLFQEAAFPENTKLTMYLPNLKDNNGANFLYNASGVTEVKLIADSIGGYSSNSMFRSKSLKTVDIEEFKAQFGNMTMMFYYAENLVSIIGELDFSITTSVSNIFIGCRSLVNLKFKPLSLSMTMSLRDPSLLSDESIQSIIDGLADLTGGTSQTLRVHKDVKARIEANSVWLEAITSKNWTLA